MQGFLPRLFCVCVLAVCWPNTPLVAQAVGESDADLQRRIGVLIEQLADEDYHRRVNAQWELERIGLAAFEQLRQAGDKHPNIQVVRLARYLIRSQDVIWWLETDSVGVRRLLKDYNTVDETARESRLQQLASEGSEDALLALCRLARFESSERLSKLAALQLMEKISSLPEPREDALPRSIKLAVGKSGRPATTWLSTLADELVASDNVDYPERWKQLVWKEHQLAEADASEEGRALVLQFYRWLGGWLTAKVDRTEALEIVRPSLDLVRARPLPIRQAVNWALDAELPELVPSLAERFQDHFDHQPQLAYLLAASFLRTGDGQAAQQTAAKASRMIDAQIKGLENVAAEKKVELEASQRYTVAQFLSDRGLFAWAKKEYGTALSLDVSERIEMQIRGEFSYFLWLGGEHSEAAGVLQPVAEAVEQNPKANAANGPFQYFDPLSYVSNYYFYEGLAAIDRGDVSAAQQNLLKSYQVEIPEPNPDVVIAMGQVAGDGPFRQHFQEAFEEMSHAYRIQVVKAEEDMSKATNRMLRANATKELAMACNQLAWLLSKCNAHPEEAIELSQRSLELLPDEPTYLDTLARCYFSAGQIQEAIRVQSQAVKLSPYERQMKVQLNEFKAAQSKDSSKPADKK